MDTLVFEPIINNRNYELERAEVPGGWLVRECTDALTPIDEGYSNMVMRSGYEWRVAITFVPDPNHQWK